MQFESLLKLVLKYSRLGNGDLFMIVVEVYRALISWFGYVTGSRCANVFDTESDDWDKEGTSKSFPR
jgi:hypothetical protein